MEREGRARRNGRLRATKGGRGTISERSRRRKKRRTLASSPNVPATGETANHPTRNGRAVANTSPTNTPSPWFPRPMAAKTRMAATSPATSFATRVPGSSSGSTLATPWKASAGRCSTGMTLMPEERAGLASGPAPSGEGRGAAADGSRRLNLLSLAGRVRPRPPREERRRSTRGGRTRGRANGGRGGGGGWRCESCVGEWSSRRDERGGDGGAATRGRSSRPRDEVGGGGWDGRRVGRAGGTETHRTRRSDARRREALEDARGARTPTGPASEIAKDMARGVSRCEGECQAEIEEDNSQPSPFNRRARAARVRRGF